MFEPRNIGVITDPESGDASLLIDHVVVTTWAKDDIPSWTTELHAVCDDRDAMGAANPTP